MAHTITPTPMAPRIRPVNRALTVVSTTLLTRHRPHRVPAPAQARRSDDEVKERL